MFEIFDNCCYHDFTKLFDAFFWFHTSKQIFPWPSVNMMWPLNYYFSWFYEYYNVLYRRILFSIEYHLKYLNSLYCRTSPWLRVFSRQSICLLWYFFFLWFFVSLLYFFFLHFFCVLLFYFFISLL